MPTSLELQLKTLPTSPGVYQYFDNDEVIIYVGKAKNLKKRVSSYFTKTHENGKTRILVKKIVRIEHIVVDRETDALLLENNLIKKYKPRYNILLKDDKSYPWLCIKKERFPRVFSTRRVIKDGSEYFGPYTNIKMVQSLLSLIKELYPLRTCTYDLSEQKITSYKYKVCLEYHLGNCKGACEGHQQEANYLEEISAIRNILKGNFKEILDKLQNLMLDFASEMKFEEAQKIKEKLALLQNYQAKSTIVNPSINNVDVFSIISDETYGYANFFKVMNGSIVQSYTTEIKKKLDESNKHLLELFIIETRNRFNSLSREVYVPFDVDLGEQIKVTVPKLGDKKRVVDLSERNAKYYRIEQLKQLKIVNPERHINRIMRQMQRDLRLQDEPRHIECFDNSNIQGTHPVGACVVFKDGKPSKKEYRHYDIKTVVGADDFASMEEVVFRRYKRLLAENEPLPQLIVIDGGKGQLSSALKSLDILGLRGKIAIIGIAKRLEEIYYPGDSVPLYLDKKSESLKIIQFLRNEAHRFGITFHRNKRSKTAIKSELEEIPGIGEQTIATLLRRFKSVKRVKEATLDALEETIGVSKAKKVVQFYQKKEL
ncbi:excinuclease ABC subunit UvrC [Tenacibaculum finnmarkense genomovar finnmarkense]|uniref:excinuclease ABC subunit UvrC n=1 Tax=Tenacibaculum finnmarkense TaxID=2781243 RepID=UPI001E501749|nr:excinuclease ABC subunit UvrC [Tenacibaculum finnmarkense]MCD8416653.1 excinuclease ABC subunit UvrC [Tenacibaculum finnmarkense genomovar finnmarkense]MCG8184635.1 excinuclease ABC subunit UvrC [Tenacibaculum finnmarkense genomovar finnmarkense]MCG8201749.1 excinuclease ABC subunit UvrC [Tenacibaculum finnmarkense genomovar finnmarkense]MCG8208659.1 excinuclease ABC subunit UvrC [Tenacibaculum finnmarkense genomovar finnmarkense]MCG8211390.1 excinuclease ABC subunit UvrC [Tenacibaculum fin